MTLFPAILYLYRGVARYLERTRLHHELVGLSNRQLDDMGYSRDLLDRGVNGWPWRERSSTPPSKPALATPVVAKAVSHALSRREIARAIAQLQVFSDAELADLGLHRSEIAHAVRYGRPGHPGDEAAAAARAAI